MYVQDILKDGDEQTWTSKFRSMVMDKKIHQWLSNLCTIHPSWKRTVALLMTDLESNFGWVWWMFAFDGCCTTLRLLDFLILDGHSTRRANLKPLEELTLTRSHNALCGMGECGLSGERGAGKAKDGFLAIDRDIDRWWATLVSKLEHVGRVRNAFWADPLEA